MSLRAVVMLLAGGIAAEIAIPALAVDVGVVIASVKGISYRALA